MEKKTAIIIISSFIGIIMTGVLLLMLPFSTTKGNLSFLDALFTSASAITVTGLVVLDTGKDFSPFGQTVIMILIQIGGLGFMTFSTLIIMMTGRSLSMKDEMIIENDFTAGKYKNIPDMVKKIFTLTFGIEAIGAILLYLQFDKFQGNKRIFYAIFHSVSAFCNAGFATLNNSFTNYQSNIGVNLTLMFLIISGGLGFLVITDIYGHYIKKDINKLPVHSKLVINTSIVLIVSGFLMVFIFEIFNKNNNLNWFDKMITSLFQIISARTAGFNTIDLNILSSSSLLLIMIHMFIGASPGSTGGGIKTSTLAVLYLFIKSKITNRNSIDVYYRQIPKKAMEKTVLVLILSIIFVLVPILIIFTFQIDINFKKTIFEVVSAFGTVGLSLGITEKLKVIPKIIIIITMFVGRVGPVTLLFALSKKNLSPDFKYPEENIMIG